MKSFRKIFFLICFLLGSLSQAFEMAQVGKFSTRKLDTPLALQGSCLLFESAGRNYCLTVYHVGEIGTEPESKSTVKTVQNDVLNLKFVASEWGLGLSLYEVMTKPSQSFLKFDQIEWVHSVPSQNADVTGVGFPASSPEVNTIYGSFSKVSVEAAHDLFMMVPEVYLIADMASEAGLSGGVLLDENEKILGLLSHQVVENKSVSTMALPSPMIETWVRQTLNSINSGREVTTYFKGHEYPESSMGTGSRMQVVTHEVSFGLTQFLPHPMVACCGSPHVYFSSVSSRTDREKPTYSFPVFQKFDRLAQKIDQKIQKLKSSLPPGMRDDQQTLQSGPYFLGCSTSDQMMRGDETWIYKRSFEVMLGFKEIALQKTPCKDLVFVNTGMLGHRVADGGWNIFKHWQQYFEQADLSSALEYKARWEDLIKFIRGDRADHYEPVNRLSMAWRTVDQLESYLQNDEARQKAFALYPAEVLQLEQIMRELIRVHRLAVYREPATQLYDLPGESSDWLKLFPSATQVSSESASQESSESATQVTDSKK